MDPISIAAVGSSLIGGLLGNNTANKQVKLQKEQLQLQRETAQEQKEFAEMLNRQGLATQIDANGNVTAYDQATNTWKTVLSPRQQNLQDASDREQYNQLNVDAPMARGEQLRNSAMRVKEAGVADGLRTRIQDQYANPTANGSQIEAVLRRNRTAAVNAGYDEVQSNAARMNLRSGTTGQAGAMSRLAKSRANQIAQTMGQPELEGMQAANDINSTNNANNINNYSAMASRASGAPGYQFTPSNIAPSLTASVAQQRGAAANSQGQAGSMLNSAANSINQSKLPVLNDPSKLWGTTSSAVLDFLAANQKPKSSNDVLDRRLGNEL